jgi:hypothetical protein
MSSIKTLPFFIVDDLNKAILRISFKNYLDIGKIFAKMINTNENESQLRQAD